MRKNIKFIALFLVVFSMLLAACDLSQIRIGWSGSSTLNNISYRYTRFSGSEVKWISLSKGDRLDLDYDIEVEKGDFRLCILDPDNSIVFQETFMEDAAGKGGCVASLNGKYQLILEGQDTGGGFDISWHVN